MRKWFSFALSTLALMLALPAAAKTAFAHGGQYRGPAGEVPPDSRQPEDPPPPDSGGGTPTPPDSVGGTPTPPDGGGGTPTPPDGGDNPGTPDPGAGGGAPQGPPAGGRTKTGGKVPKKQGPSYESWLFWWNYNKDRIINIKKAIHGAANKSGGGLTSLTESGSGNESETQDITAQTVKTQVVPMLRKFAEDSKVNFDIQASGVVGLAKIGSKDALPLMMRMVRNEGTEQYHKVVEETAALSIGILQERTPEARKFLGEVAQNPAAKVRTRCFASFALGMLGDPFAAPGSNAATLDVLKSILRGAESNKDIHNSALVAIGLLGDASAIPDLVTWLNEEKIGTNKLSDVTLSYVAAALGKIGQPTQEVLTAFATQVKGKNRMTRYSTIIALGQVAPQGDEKVQSTCVKMLVQVVKSEGKSGVDTQSVNFAMASLGRIGGVAPDVTGKGGCPAAVREMAYNELMDAFKNKATLRSFSALGLGILGKDLPETVKQPIGEAIRNTLAKTSGDVEVRGSMVISLGLLKDIQSASLLQTLLQDKGLDKKLRGTAAVALGLIGDRSALEVVHKALMEKDDRELRVDTAIAAGLLHDTDAVPAMVDILKDPKASQFILGSVATALGQIGDQRAVEPLCQILTDDAKQYPDLTRALAATALGQIGDKTDVSVLSRLSEDVNYRAYYDAMGEVLTIL